MIAHDTFNLIEMKKELEMDEGYKKAPYRDTVGKITIGVGRNLTDNGLSDSEIDFMLENDIENCYKQLQQKYPWFLSLPEPQQRVMINLCFNMGLNRLAQFGTFLGFMSRREFAQAAADLETTAWYEQVGERGPRMVERLKLPNPVA